MIKTEINPNTRYVVPMLRITQCPDPMRWYAGMVGHLVPHRAGHQPIASEYLSAEPSGFANLVQAEDCKEVKVSVSGRRLSEWPYAPVAAAAKPATNLFDGDVFVPGFAGPVVGLPPKTCAASCNAMGICQALEDCQDKPRIDAELARTAAPAQAVAVGQSRTHSMAETLASIAVGFVISMVIQALAWPLFGHQITLAANFWMTCIFTVASVLRGYGMRRFFNHLHTRAHP
jgi:hypothetical protein